ncbi:MFS transporter, partial [halophilic archaeon]
MATTDIPSTAAGGSDRFIYLTAALAALNGLLFGFDTGIISGAFLYINDTFTMSPLV